MWLISPEHGFFSIVDRGRRGLAVRARVAGDLDRLRDSILPELGPTIMTSGADYRFRAYVARAPLARAMSRLARSISWGNVKAAVRRVDGPRREAVYHRVWAALRDLEEPRPRGLGCVRGRQR